MDDGSIRNVSDTARWVAVYRAMESERPDAHFHDPYARRLAGERGEAILRAMPRGRSMSWPMVVRTCVFDEVIRRLVDRHGVTTVLNLAAGLDARPYRLPLPASLRWIEVDLPEILAHKEEILRGERAACEVERVGLDLADRPARQALFARVQAAAGGAPVLVLSEGLLIYLTASAVGELAADLAAQPAYRWWLIDLAAPELLRRMEKGWGKALAAGNAPFRFAPAAGVDFFPPFGWREAEFHSTWEDAQRLRREMKGAWLWRLLGRLAPPAKRERFRRFSGSVLLERADSGRSEPRR
jgi:methyltransferase (TIGR00027 family)